MPEVVLNSIRITSFFLETILKTCTVTSKSTLQMIQQQFSVMLNCLMFSLCLSVFMLQSDNVLQQTMEERVRHIFESEFEVFWDVHNTYKTIKKVILLLLPFHHPYFITFDVTFLININILLFSSTNQT